MLKIFKYIGIFIGIFFLYKGFIAIKNFEIGTGDRIAQMLFFSVFTPEFKLVKNFDESERGIEGFGSSGKI